MKLRHSLIMLKKIVFLLLLSTNCFAADMVLDRIHQTLGIGRIRYSVTENPNYLIKPGTYKVILSYSQRLDQTTPELIVPGREGIRIHVVKNLKAGYALR